MIALGLGLLIMTALTGLFVNTSRTNQEMARTNSQMENARFALALLKDDLVHGGYWGGFIPAFDDLTNQTIPSDWPLVNDVPTIVPDPCLAYASWASTAGYVNALIGIPVQTHIDSTQCTGVISNQQTSTDVLVVRHAATCALVWNGTGFVAESGNCPADVTGAAYFQPSRCTSDASPYVLGRAGTDTFGMQRRQCDGQLSPRMRVINNIYYVRDFSVTAGDGIPTLVRSELGVASSAPSQVAAQALVEGIQGFRVELGVDSLSETGALVNYAAAIDWQPAGQWTTATNRGDGVPDGTPPFVHCPTTTRFACTTNNAATAAALANVVAVRIWVLARADQPTPGYTDRKTYTLGSEGGGQTLGPFNDGFKRRVFATTARLVNVTGRRETP
jgi:type IV pilus assembly protein PilW